MKTLLLLSLMILDLCASTKIFAEVLPKDVMEVKETFDQNGATGCSQAIADTINFLANGRSFNYSALWGTTESNKKPITLDYLISGGKDDYSTNGTIVLIPMGDRCVGDYVYSFVAPSPDCKVYMHKIGSNNQDWNKYSTYKNGDGGTAYFSTLNNNSNINFIFNDVVGGCSVTKREMINLNASK